MGQAPENQTIQAVVENNKVTFQGEALIFDVLPPKGGQLPPLAVGQELRGWLNPDGQHGPYFKIAAEQAPSTNGSAPSGGARTDATGRSIERQVALKAAAEFYSREPKTPVATIVATAEAFDEFLAASARSGGSPPPASAAADPQSAVEGTNTAASPSMTSDVPDF